TATSQGFVKVSRHPFLVAVALWAIGHIAANGDVASLILFGALLLLASVGTRLIDAKRRQAGGADWQHFVAGTSIVPFAATFGGRNRVTLADVGWWRIALGLALYAVLLWGHRWAFGVSALPSSP
ncbi:MAG: NnrU family protein, partial [Alphaproteobacteria bacterium]|nr:NnrU family protein [Alphaproteobacteria bacterium]